MMDVDPRGSPHSTQVLFELPIGQGFEGAARACASHFHFAPALDLHGHPVGGHARIALRFERRWFGRVFKSARSLLGRFHASLPAKMLDVGTAMLAGCRTGQRLGRAQPTAAGAQITSL